MAESVGITSGVFLSTATYIALSSIEFCNLWIYRSPQTEPILNEKYFFIGWSVIVAGVTLFMMLFKRESDDKNPPEEDDEEEFNTFFKMINVLIEITKN